MLSDRLGLAPEAKQSSEIILERNQGEYYTTFRTLRDLAIESDI